ncbi:hypothetical protein ACWC2H_35280 [Streptomyces sp. 900105755]
MIATQPAVAGGAKVISAVGARDEDLAGELGASPVRSGLVAAVRALGSVDAVFDAAGKGALADAVELAGGPQRVIALSDHAAPDFGVGSRRPPRAALPVPWTRAWPCWPRGRLRMKNRRAMPLQEAAEAHRLLESGDVRDRVILTLDA